MDKLPGRKANEKSNLTDFDIDASNKMRKEAKRKLRRIEKQKYNNELKTQKEK